MTVTKKLSANKLSSKNLNDNPFEIVEDQNKFSG